jgi:hypothetical protein
MNPDYFIGRTDNLFLPKSKRNTKTKLMPCQVQDAKVKIPLPKKIESGSVLQNIKYVPNKDDAEGILTEDQLSDWILL